MGYTGSLLSSASALLLAPHGLLPACSADLWRRTESVSLKPSHSGTSDMHMSSMAKAFL